MKLEKNAPMVVIEFPQICIPLEESERYILAAHRFWNETNTSMIDNFKGERFTYDTRYYDGESIPTIKHTDTYSDIFSENICVRQIDEYVSIDKKDGYVDINRVNNCWLCQENEDE